MITIQYLLENSHLPGPRGNLELLYQFSKEGERAVVDQCLDYIHDNLKNSPEEFVAMCGIVRYAILNRQEHRQTISFLMNYASHSSWRIREAVAMGIQEISENMVSATIEQLQDYLQGNAYELRAIVAGLCEPKLLTDQDHIVKVLQILEKITQKLDHDQKLTTPEESLRKALGYGWSVVIVSLPEEGKRFFEKLFSLGGRHIQWIIQENLKKNRLRKMDAQWVNWCWGQLKSNPK